MPKAYACAGVEFLLMGLAHKAQRFSEYKSFSWFAKVLVQGLAGTVIISGRVAIIPLPL
jgi:hypothetical protein